jgi:hypothetical protein
MASQAAAFSVVMGLPPGSYEVVPDDDSDPA